MIPTQNERTSFIEICEKVESVYTSLIWICFKGIAIVSFYAALQAGALLMLGLDPIAYPFSLGLIMAAVATAVMSFFIPLSSGILLVTLHIKQRFLKNQGETD